MRKSNHFPCFRCNEMTTTNNNKITKKNSEKNEQNKKQIQMMSKKKCWLMLWLLRWRIQNSMYLHSTCILSTTKYNMCIHGIHMKVASFEGAFKVETWTKFHSNRMFKNYWPRLWNWAWKSHWIYTVWHTMGAKIWNYVKI